MEKHRNVWKWKRAGKVVSRRRTDWKQGSFSCLKTGVLFGRHYQVGRIHNTVREEDETEVAPIREGKKKGRGGPALRRKKIIGEKKQTHSERKVKKGFVFRRHQGSQKMFAGLEYPRQGV